jgi:hypothetical protein
VKSRWRPVSSAPHRLPAITLLDAVDSQATVAIAAELEGATDEDWFKQGVEQSGAAQVQPTIEVTASEAVRVCLYVGCSLAYRFTP